MCNPSSWVTPRGFDSGDGGGRRPAWRTVQAAFDQVQHQPKRIPEVERLSARPLADDTAAGVLKIFLGALVFGHFERGDEGHRGIRSAVDEQSQGAGVELKLVGGAVDQPEAQDVGVETSAQLQAFCNAFGTFGTVQYIWMSATIGEKQLTTVDHQIPIGGLSRISLGPDERTIPAVSKKFEAPKPLKKASLKLDKENEKNYPREFAALLRSVHKNGTLTLAVVNRVSRAQQIFEELLKNGRTKDDTSVLHSRFREGDRRARMMLLDEKQDRIIVATQVVEAGVDVSARTLITELAPWPSLVQRLGRCNRRGSMMMHQSFGSISN